MNKDYEFKLFKLLLGNCDVEYEEADGMSQTGAFFEVDDEDYFKEIMGDVPINKENILRFYEKDPDYLQVKVDSEREEYDYKHWNVDVWRNS